MEKIKTGLAAYGMSGQVFHAPFISTHPHFELTAITERNKTLSRNRYPEAIITRSIEELIDMKDIELVVINTPDDTHYAYARKALLAGKHVIVEKPFTNTTEEGKELIALAEEKKRMLSVYQNRRWDADFLTLQEILGKNLLGRPVEYKSTFARFRNYIQEGNWKEEKGGMTYNLGSHLIDQAVYLFGMPEAVFADIAILRDSGKVDDYFTIHLLRPSKNPDIRVTLKASYLMCEAEPRFILHGTNGSYIKYGVDKQEVLLKKGASPNQKHWGEETEEEWGMLHTENSGTYLREKYPSIPGNYGLFYENIYRHLRLGQPLQTDARNILDVIRIIEAAKESNQTQSIVKL